MLQQKARQIHPVVGWLSLILMVAEFMQKKIALCHIH
jgi:hypothetical protein